MIDHLDNLLHRLFRYSIAELSADAQIRFQPPDQDWRGIVTTITDGAGNPGNSLNVYLIDLRENRRLRSNEREKMVVGQDIFEIPPARRVDCHYLISAWSPVTVTIGIDPTFDEHALLAETARVLGAHDELDPVAIYALSNPPAPPPPVIADERFPLTLLPVEGFPKFAEFWGTMGDKNRWKPCVYTVITVPLKETALPAGPMVTTAMMDTRLWGVPVTANTLMQFGGTIRASAVPNAPPVAGAWVDLLTTTGARRQLVRTDINGRFLFVQVAAGTYQIRVSATGFGSFVNPIDVPAPAGSYDMHF
ncbi:MAG TPA: Pvc16 family protein [Micropepsaceae bacterium]|jgi:hypothetical protein